MVSQIQCFLPYNIFDLNRRLKWFFVEWYFIQIFSKSISDRIESEKISKELKTAQYAYCMLHFIAIFESNLWSMWNEHFNRTRTYSDLWLRLRSYKCFCFICLFKVEFNWKAIFWIEICYKKMWRKTFDAPIFFYTF